MDHWTAGRWRLLYALGVLLDKVSDADHLNDLDGELLENRYRNALQAVSKASSEEDCIPALRELIAVTGELVARECGFEKSQFRR